MSLSTPPVSAAANTITPPLQKNPVHSSLSDVVKIALPIIAMLAGFVFLPMEGAILFSGMIIGGYIYYDYSDKKPLDNTAEEKPPIPAKPENEASKVPSTESSKKKHKTPSSQRKISDNPPPSASQYARTAESYLNPKSSDEESLRHARSKSLTPARQKNDVSKVPSSEPAKKTHRTPSLERSVPINPPHSEGRFGRPARIRMSESNESSDDEPSPPVVRKPSTPAQPKRSSSKTPTPSAKPNTSTLSQPSLTPFAERYGTNPTVLTFIRNEDNSNAPGLGSSMLTPQVSATPSLLPETPYNIQLRSPVRQDPPFTESIVRPEGNPVRESPSSEELSQSISQTPVNRSLPPLYPKSNRTTELRREAIAVKFGRNSDQASSGSDLGENETRSVKKLSEKTPASSGSEHSETPDVRRGTSGSSYRTTPRQKTVASTSRHTPKSRKLFSSNLTPASSESEHSETPRSSYRTDHRPKTAASTSRSTPKTAASTSRHTPKSRQRSSKLTQASSDLEHSNTADGLSKRQD